MDDLREHLKEIEGLPQPDLWHDIEDRASRGGDALTLDREASPTVGRRVRAGIAAVLIFFIAASFAWVGLRHLSSGQPSDQIADREARIPIPRPQAMVAGNDAVWVVSGTTSGEEQLWRIDTATNQATLIPGTTGVFSTAAVGEGAVWVITCRPSPPHECATTSLLKIDPASGHILARAPLPSAGFQVTTGLGFVWVDIYQELLKVDPASMRIVARLPGPFDQIGVADGYLWALGGGGRGLRKIDPSTGLDVQVGGVHGDCSLLATETSVWVTSCKGGRPGTGPDHLFVVDPSTSKLRYQVPFEGGVLSYDGAHPWVSRSTESGASLQQLDPATGSPTEIVVDVPFGSQPWMRHGIGASFIDTVIGSGSFWLTNLDLNDVVRVPLPRT